MEKTVTINGKTFVVGQDTTDELPFNITEFLSALLDKNEEKYEAGETPLTDDEILALMSAEYGNAIDIETIRVRQYRYTHNKDLRGKYHSFAYNGLRYEKEKRAEAIKIARPKDPRCKARPRNDRRRSG